MQYFNFPQFKEKNYYGKPSLCSACHKPTEKQRVHRERINIKCLKCQKKQQTKSVKTAI